MSIEDLSQLSEAFEGNEWCNDCRDWYKSNLKECPECTLSELKCIYCKHPCGGGIMTHSGYYCTKCLVDEHEKLKEGLREIRAITPTVYDNDRMTHKIINEVLGAEKKHKEDCASFRFGGGPCDCGVFK